MEMSNMSVGQVIVLGGGGHAKVLIYTLQLYGHHPIGYPDPVSSQPLLGVPDIGDDETVFRYGPEDIALVNGLAGVGAANMRAKVFDVFQERGYTFIRIIHSSAVIAPDVTISEGTQIPAGAVVLPGSFTART